MGRCCVLPLDGINNTPPRISSLDVYYMNNESREQSKPFFSCLYCQHPPEANMESGGTQLVEQNNGIHEMLRSGPLACPI